MRQGWRTVRTVRAGEACRRGNARRHWQATAARGVRPPASRIARGVRPPASRIHPPTHRTAPVSCICKRGSMGSARACMTRYCRSTESGMEGVLAACFDSHGGGSSLSSRSLGALPARGGRGRARHASVRRRLLPPRWARQGRGRATYSMTLCSPWWGTASPDHARRGPGAGAMSCA